jgi:hypothetical protein
MKQEKTVKDRTRRDFDSHPRVRRNRQKEGERKEVYKETRKL